MAAAFITGHPCCTESLKIHSCSSGTVVQERPLVCPSCRPYEAASAPKVAVTAGSTPAAGRLTCQLLGAGSSLPCPPALAAGSLEPTPKTAAAGAGGLARLASSSLAGFASWDVRRQHQPCVPCESPNCNLVGAWQASKHPSKHLLLLSPPPVDTLRRWALVKRPGLPVCLVHPPAQCKAPGPPPATLTSSKLASQWGGPSLKSGSSPQAWPASLRSGSQ